MIEATTTESEGVMIPAALYVAMASRRPELVKLVDPASVDVQQLLKVIHFLFERNIELEDKMTSVAQRNDDMIGQLLGIMRSAKEIQRHALKAVNEDEDCYND